MKLQLCDFSYRDYFHSMLHLIKCQYFTSTSHLSRTKVLQAPHTTPRAATSHSCGKTLEHHKVLKFTSTSPPWETQVSAGKNIWHKQITPNKWKSLILPEIGKTVSPQFSVLPALHLRKALQCCAKYASWVF